MPPVDFTQALNIDALDVLYTYFDVSELHTLRLVNRQSREIASQYLLHTIVFRPQKQIFEKITNISKNQEFVKGITQGMNEEPFKNLTTALAKFTGLKRVSLYSWARRMESLQKIWDEDEHAVDPQDGKHGKLSTFNPQGNEVPTQTEAFYFLLRALGAAGRSVEIFEVKPVLEHRVGTVLFDRERAGDNWDELNLHMLISFGNLDGIKPFDLVRPLQRLKKLDLQLRSHTNILEHVKISLEQVVMRRVEGEDGILYLSRLGRIPLAKVLPTDHTFSHLRKVELRHFWLNASELCDFYARQAATLEQIVLSFIVLGGTRYTTVKRGSPALQQIQKHTKVTVEEPAAEPATQSNDSTPAQSAANTDTDSGSDLAEKATELQISPPSQLLPPECDQVAQACQALPKLNGVEFQAAMDDSSKEAKSLALLEERAMNGRPNMQHTGKRYYTVGERADKSRARA